MRKHSMSSIWVAGRDWLERSFGRSPGGKPASICRRQCWHWRGRGVYDERQQAEIVRFLQETAERFDLIVAADVLNYFGDLSPVFTGIACVLRPGGHCAVTLEAGKGDYRLRGMRRYQHAGEYVQRTAATAGLARCVFDEVELRASTASRCGPGEVCGAVRNRRWGRLPRLIAAGSSWSRDKLMSDREGVQGVPGKTGSCGTPYVILQGVPGSSGDTIRNSWTAVRLGVPETPYVTQQ